MTAATDRWRTLIQLVGRTCRHMIKQQRDIRFGSESSDVAADEVTVLIS
jgi:hypothetical protein